MSIRVAKFIRGRGMKSQSLGLDTQNHVLDTYINSRDGWELAADCVYTDTETNHHAAPMDRPALRRALRDARQGRYGILLVYRLDRLAHSTRDLLMVVGYLDRHGVALHSATEPVDTASAAGRALAQTLMDITAHERPSNPRKH